MPVALVRGSVQSFTPVGITYPAFILRDSSAVRWANTILPAGNLYSVPTVAGPLGALDVTPLVLQDSGGILWQVTILTTGNLVTTVVPSSASPFTSIRFLDFNSSVHILTVSTTGDLLTA